MTQRLLLISGGIGTGKSAVRDALEQRGFVVIDADAEGHAVLAPGGEAVAAVAERWPSVVENGVVDRRALGRIVFEDAGELEALEAITHGEIRARIRGKIVDAEGAPVAVELPLPSQFLGPGWTRVVVDAPLATRYERLRSRGLDDHEIESRIAAQATRDEWLAIADHVIDNSGTLEDLDAAVDRLVEDLELNAE